MANLIVRKGGTELVEPVDHFFEVPVRE